MHAFIATVPFTILEAINYVICKDIKDADLYVVKVFSDVEQVAKRIEKTGVFKRVFIVEDVLLTYPITIKKCLNVVKNGNKILKILEKERYDYIYYNNSGWLINSIFYTGVLKKNRNVKNIFLEHGYYSYTNDYADKPWYLGILIRLFGFRCMDGSMVDELHVFHPELMNVRYDGQLLKMPRIDKNNPKIVSAINEAFGYTKSMGEDNGKDIFVLEQGPQKFDFDKDAFWKRVFEIIDIDKTIVKAHPRQKQSTLVDMGAEIYKNHTIPWEVELLNSDLEKCYQITIFSGSCVSPKLIFDEEPTVIFLYNLLPVSTDVWNQELLDFSNALGLMYQNKDRYFIPNSFEELETYCKDHGIGKINKRI